MRSPLVRKNAAMGKWIIGLLVVAGIVAAVVRANGNRGTVVDVAPVETGEMTAYVEEQAKTRVPEVFEITMPLQGRILPITLREGDQVAKGQVVAKMDIDDLETDVLKKATQVDRMVQAFLAVANRKQANDAQVAASKAKFNYAKSQLERQKKLLTDSATTENKVEEVELLKVQAESDLRKDELDATDTLLWEAALRLFETEYSEELRQAKRDRGRAEIHATVGGTVLSKTVSNEKVLSAGSVLLEIGDLTQLEIESDVLTQDVVRVKVGDPVQIEGASIGAKPITGHVTRIFPQGFTKVSSLGVEQQRVKVIVGFDTSGLAELQAQERVLGVDYRLRVKIFTDKKGDALKVPRAAVFRDGAGKWQVFTVRGEQARKTGVEIGLMNEFEVEIVSGVSAGDQIVLAPPAGLKDGDQVRPMSIPK